mgnify:CR=1 FL=1
MATDTQAGEDPLSEYKIMLRDLIERRPSGTRQRIAEAFGTHKSFISQIINPNYRVPLPAQHIPALFDVCHFSAEEQEAFLKVYARAHPNQAAAIEELAGIERDVVHIKLPEFADPMIRREVEAAIRASAEQIIKMAEKLLKKN